MKMPKIACVMVLGVMLLGGCIAPARRVEIPATLPVVAGTTTEGIDAGPEAGAGLLALRTLQAEGTIKTDDVTVLFSTGGNKYR